MPALCESLMTHWLPPESAVVLCRPTVCSEVMVALVSMGSDSCSFVGCNEY